MHQTIQVATTKETTGIDAVGISTRISKDSIAKLIAVYKDGNRTPISQASPIGA